MQDPEAIELLCNLLRCPEKGQHKAALRAFLEIYAGTTPKDRGLGIRIKRIAEHMLEKEETKTSGDSRARVLYSVLGYFGQRPGGRFLSIENSYVSMNLEKLQEKIQEDWEVRIDEMEREKGEREKLLGFVQGLAAKNAKLQPSELVESWIGDDEFEQRVKALVRFAFQTKLPVRIMTRRFSSLELFPTFKRQFAELAKETGVEVVLHAVEASKETREWLRSHNVTVYERSDKEFVATTSRFLLVGDHDGITVDGKEVVSRSGIYFRHYQKSPLHKTFEKLKKP